jgi:hypothetical protein
MQAHIREHGSTTTEARIREHQPSDGEAVVAASYFKAL